MNGDLFFSAFLLSFPVEFPQSSCRVPVEFLYEKAVFLLTWHYV